MKEIRVPVRFEGVVTVKVLEGLEPKVENLLAEKLALANILATTDNPDATVSEACEAFAEEAKLDEYDAGRLFDQSQIGDVAGLWQILEE